VLLSSGRSRFKIVWWDAEFPMARSGRRTLSALGVDLLLYAGLSIIY